MIATSTAPAACACIAAQEAARQGATAAPPADEEVDLHFVSFVAKGGRLWELDGRKQRAVDCGASTGGGALLADAAAVIRRKFVEGSSSLSFTLMALAAAE